MDGSLDDQHPDGDPPAPHPLARTVWAILGVLCVAVGTVGVILPGLPTTVFFIGAAAAFSRSSPRLEAWVLGLPTIGPAVRDYRAGLGMPRQAKLTAVAMIIAFVGLSIVLAGSTWLRVVLATAGVIGVAVVVRTPTRPPPDDDPGDEQRPR